MLKNKKPAAARWTKWAAAAACLCLAAAGILQFTGIAGKNHVQTWKDSYNGADYFMYAGKGDSQSSEKSIADVAIQYAESRDYSGDRSLMEENGVIPSMESHPLFYPQANFNIDENGSVLEPTVTVTERDGVQIIARGREDQKKTITFRNETGWYQISGSGYDSCEDAAALFEWFGNHPIDFSRFKQEDGDLYTYTTLKEMPDA